jgi:hypothetical protein
MIVVCGSCLTELARLIGKPKKWKGRCPKCDSPVRIA